MSTPAVRQPSPKDEEPEPKLSDLRIPPHRCCTAVPGEGRWGKLGEGVCWEPAGHPGPHIPTDRRVRPDRRSEGEDRREA